MVETITSPELSVLLTAGNVDLVDVRDERDWLAGHIPGSRNIPLETLRADPDAFLARDRAIAFVCQRGVRSLTAAKLAERLGFDRIYNVDGGTQAWAKAGLAIAHEAQQAAA